MAMVSLSRLTEHNTKLHLQIALNYGGEDELDRALRSLGKTGGPFTLEGLKAHLDTAEVPDPDLVIRTSGEQRTSGFMPLQIAKAELYFTERDWPDFTFVDFEKALHAYSKRDRRFGALSTAAE